VHRHEGRVCTRSFSTRVSILPSLPLTPPRLSSPLSLSHPLSFSSFFTKPEHGARSDSNVALVGKIEATARPRIRAFWTSRRLLHLRHHLRDDRGWRLDAREKDERRARRRISRTFQLTDDNSTVIHPAPCRFFTPGLVPFCLSSPSLRVSFRFVSFPRAENVIKPPRSRGADVFSAWERRGEKTREGDRDLSLKKKKGVYKTLRKRQWYSNACTRIVNRVTFTSAVRT